MKKSILCLMASLLIGGAAIAQESAYVRAHDNNMPVVAQVVLDEIPVTSNEWTLKAYIGEDQRGEAEIQTDLDNTYWIQVYYSTETESTNTPVTFTITDGTDEYTSTTTLNTLAEGYGTPSNPQVIEFAAMQTQEITLAAGWNWFSTYIAGDAEELLWALEESLGDNGVLIKSKEFATDYLGEEDGWDGDLEEVGLTNDKMYMIKTSRSCTVTLQGMRSNPATVGIQIKKGWNWIGFPFAEEVSVAVAFADFPGEEGDILKTLEASTDYYGPEDGWDGDLETMEPGKGYMYYSVSDTPKTLVFSTGTGSKAPRAIDLPK